MESSSPTSLFSEEAGIKPAPARSRFAPKKLHFLIIFVLLMVVGLASALILIRSSQDVRQQAASKNPPTLNKTTSFNRDTMTVKVQVVIYDPILELQGGVRLHEARGWQNPEVLSAQFADELNQSSHGRITYQIVETTVRDEWPLHASGQRYTDLTYQTPPPDDPFGPVNYLAVIADNQIEQKVNAGLVDEVWLWGAPNFAFAEAAMAGEGAFWLNGSVIEGVNSKGFAIMGLNYERNVGLAMHSYGHRAESTMAKMYGVWDNAPTNDWSAFSLVDHIASDYEFSGCGNDHFPANGTDDYDYDNPNPASSYCDSFNNFPNYDINDRQTITCTAWNPNCGVPGTDSQTAYFRWWFGHMPHVAGIKNGYLNNWWRYLGDPYQYRTRAVYIPHVFSSEHTENNANLWTCEALNSTASCSNDATHVTHGQSSIRFDSMGLDDSSLKYPAVGNANLNLSNYQKLSMNVYSLNENDGGFQGEVPLVYLRNDNGSYIKISPVSGGVLNDSINSWKTISIPIDGDENWTSTSSGTPNLNDIDQIEIHLDTYGAGITVFFDGVRFSKESDTDSQAPSVIISNPTPGANLSGTVSISVEAQDESTLVHGTELYVDGQPALSDTVWPYIFHWDANTVAPGNHTLTAKAYDLFGNEATSPGINVVTSASPCLPPNLTVNRTCSGETMNATWSWSTAPYQATYRLQVDDASNFSSPLFNGLATSPKALNQIVNRQHSGRIRVESKTGSYCQAPGTWSSPIITPTCVNPLPSPAPDSCQCIQGKVTVNNCVNGSTPTCSGFSKCQCISNN